MVKQYAIIIIESSSLNHLMFGFFYSFALQYVCVCVCVRIGGDAIYEYFKFSLIHDN